MPYQLLAVLKVKEENGYKYEVVSSWMKESSGPYSLRVYRNFIRESSGRESLGAYVHPVTGGGWLRRTWDSLFSKTRERAITRQEELYLFQGKPASEENDRKIKDILSR